jgi:hypothetical protein
MFGRIQQYKMRNKKGAVESSTLVKMLIVLAVMIVIIVSYVKVAGVFEGEAFDFPCTINAKIRSYGPTPTTLAQITTGSEGVGLPLCQSRETVVKANDWDACDSEEKGWEESYKESKDDKYLRKCVTYQVYDLAHNCWQKYGANGIDMGAVTEVCYYATVTGLKEDDYFIQGDVETSFGGIVQHFDTDWVEDADYERSFDFELGFYSIDEHKGNGEYVISYIGEGLGLLGFGYTVYIDPEENW